MKFKYIQTILLLFIVLGVGFSSETLAQKKRREKDIFAKADAPPQGEGDISRMSERFFIEGMRLYALKDYEEALKKFKKSEEIITQAASIKFQIARVYQKQEKWTEALDYVSQALALDDSNLFYHDLKIELYLVLEKPEKSIEILENLTRNVKNIDKRYFFNLASLYVKTLKFEEALAVFSKMETNFGTSKQLLDLKQHCLVSLNKTEDAILLGEHFIEKHPDDKSFIETHIDLLLSLEAYSYVKKWLTYYDKKFKKDAVWHFFNAKFSETQKKYDESLESINIAFKSPSIPFEGKFHLLLRYLPHAGNDSSLVSAGLKLAKTLNNIHVNHPKASELYGEFLMYHNELKNAQSAYLNSLKIDENNFVVWQKVVEIDVKLKQYDQLIFHTEEAMILFPNQPFFYLFNGLGYQINGQYETALEVLEEAEKRSTTANTSFRIQLYSLLGDTYHKSKSYQKSEEAYEWVLRTDPNNLYVLHNYSYHLAQRKKNLKKALDMSKQLIRLAPYNPGYLGVHGHILFMTGKYKEAKKYLEKALKNAPENALILEHYGDILYKLGETDKAIEQWKKAKQIGGEHSKELNRKLLEKKMID